LQFGASFVLEQQDTSFSKGEILILFLIGSFVQVCLTSMFVLDDDHMCNLYKTTYSLMKYMVRASLAESLKGLKPKTASSRIWDEIRVTEKEAKPKKNSRTRPKTQISLKFHLTQPLTLSLIPRAANTLRRRP
jgi:hypothetical protein